MAHDPGYDLRKIYEQIELDLVSSQKRNLKRHEAWEEKEGFKWEQWQQAKLRNMRAYRTENKRIVDAGWKRARKTIKEALWSAFARNVSAFRNWLNKAFKIKPEILYPVDERDIQGNTPFEDQRENADNSFFGMNETKLNALEKSIENDFHKANSAILRKTEDIYRETIFNAEMHMGAGAKTLDQAIDLATKDFLKQGINCIEYKDGRRVNIASYAEMALRTAAHRATLMGEGQKRDEYGVYTVVVSVHANTCPLCAPWQGKILIDDVFTSLAENPQKAARLSKEAGYPLLSTAIDKGLLHPNCRHSLITYFPGVTQLPKAQDAEEAMKKYDAEQEQRAYERAIRRSKRILAGSLDPENAERAAKEVKEYQNLLRDHLIKHPYLRRDYAREKTRDIPEGKTTNSKYGYENFDRKHLAKSDLELLPNREKAYNITEKLLKYSLNKNHPIGRDKAIAFAKYLGYNQENQAKLNDEIYIGLSKYRAAARAETKYGKPYEVAMVIKGTNGQYARIKTGWIMEKGSDMPRMTTAYVDE